MGIFQHWDSLFRTGTAQDVWGETVIPASSIPRVHQPPLTPEEMKGASGEAAVCRELERIIGAGCPGTIYRNIQVPKGNSATAEIDVLFLTKKALYVIESKNYSGWIFGNADDKTWTETFRNGHKEYFPNPVWQNEGHCRALSRYLNQPLQMPLISVIVFGWHCELKNITCCFPYKAVITQLDSLARTIVNNYNAIGNFVPDKELAYVYDHLQSLARDREHLKDDHVRQMRERCPVCGGKLVERKNGKTGESFYGCSNYPNCKFTRKIS